MSTNIDVSMLGAGRAVLVVSPARPVPVSRPQFTATAIEQMSTITKVSSQAEREGHLSCDDQSTNAPLFAEIRSYHRTREYLHKHEKSLTNTMRAICLMQCDGAKAEAAMLLKLILKNEIESLDNAIIASACQSMLQGFEVMRAQRLTAEREMGRLAKQLPVHEWWVSVPGRAAVGLAQIIGELGSPSNYATPAKVWKRMGVGIVDGERQRKKKGRDGIKHGYSPRRHGVIWRIADSAQRHKKTNHYGPIYASRREHTATTHPEWSKQHSHDDARRYIAKRMLLELWSEWRKEMT